MQCHKNDKSHAGCANKFPHHLGYWPRQETTETTTVGVPGSNHWLRAIMRKWTRLGSYTAMMHDEWSPVRRVTISRKAQTGSAGWQCQRHMRALPMAPSVAGFTD